MNKIFGELDLDDEGFDEFVNCISGQYGVDFDEFNEIEDYTKFLIILFIIVCPPLYIAVFIDYIYRIIKFRKKNK